MLHISNYCRNISDVLWEAISTNQVLSLYQGLGTKNLQSFISQFVYFYGYSFFKKLYLEKSGTKTIGTKANLITAAAAGACTVLITQVIILGMRFCPFKNNKCIFYIVFGWRPNCFSVDCPITLVQLIDSVGTSRR